MSIKLYEQSFEMRLKEYCKTKFYLVIIRIIQEEGIE